MDNKKLTEEMAVKTFKALLEGKMPEEEIEQKAKAAYKEYLAAPSREEVDARLKK